MTEAERALLKLVAGLLLKATDGDIRHRTTTPDERRDLSEALASAFGTTEGA